MCPAVHGGRWHSERLVAGGMLRHEGERIIESRGTKKKADGNHLRYETIIQ